MQKVVYFSDITQIITGVVAGFTLSNALMHAFPKPIHLAHQFVRNVVKTGDIAVDATLGNGHDALFLSKLVGEKGMVYGFDVQEVALQSSEERMEACGVEAFEFFLAGHERMADFVKAEVAVVMFNLGYLPRADKAVITTEQTTLPAVEAALALLKTGGLLTIMCYPGHEGGDVESAAVVKWCGALAREDYRVAQFGLLNAPNNPPFLVVVEKSC